MQKRENNPHTRLALLGLGASAGIIIASLGLVEQWSFSPAQLPQNAIARVGERLITRQRYQQLLSDLASDKREPLKPEDRQFVLDRLVDEELLIARGIELGLAESSPEIRKAFAANVIAQVVTEAQVSPPTEEDLRRLFESDRGFFSSSARYRLLWLRLNGSGNYAGQTAGQAYRQLRSGASPDQVIISTAGLERVNILPDVLLPMGKIRDYMGPDLALLVTGLESGEYSSPSLANGDFHILYLAQYQAAEPPEFEQIRVLVEAEYLRRKGDEALKQYLGWLRQRSDIVVDREKMDTP